MAVDPDQIAEISRASVDLYKIAESSIAQLVTRTILQGIDGPSWAVDRLAALGQLRNATQAILAHVDDLAPDYMRQAVAEGYRQGDASVLTDLPLEAATRLGAREALRTVPRSSAMESLASALVQDVGSRHSNVVRHIADVYRQVIAAGTASSVAGGLTRRQASQLAYQRAVDQGITSFVDARGRTWRLSSYVEMGLRTVTQRAAVQGQTDKQQRLGLPFVVVSNAAQECERCRPYEGRVLRINAGPIGSTTAANPATGDLVTFDVKATLDAARAAGFQHPNCRHSVRTYLPGVTQLPKQPTADPAGDDARQRQRAIERQIRRWKEREAAALTPEAKAAAAAKTRGWNATMRDHLAANPDLKRLRYREQIGAGNLPKTPTPATRLTQTTPAPATAAPPPLPRRTRVTEQPPPVERLADLLDVDLDAELNRKMVRDVFADVIGGDYAGLNVKITDVARKGTGGARPGLSVRGEIFRDGESVGRVQRSFYRDRDGNLVVVHALLFLDKQVRGRGFAGAFNGHLEQWYRRQGVNRIEVHANIDVGGYTWATQGFGFEDERSAGEVLDRLRFMVDLFNGRVFDLREAADKATGQKARDLREQARKTLAQIEAADAILERAADTQFGDADFPTSHQISQAGRSEDLGDERYPWIGKAAMLGSDWHGVKWL